MNLDLKTKVAELRSNFPRHLALPQVDVSTRDRLLLGVLKSREQRVFVDTAGRAFNEWKLIDMCCVE